MLSFPIFLFLIGHHRGTLGGRTAHGGANAAPEPNTYAQVLFGSGIQRLSAGATRLFSAPRPRPDRFSCLELANRANGPHIARRQEMAVGDGGKAHRTGVPVKMR